MKDGRPSHASTDSEAPPASHLAAAAAAAAIILVAGLLLSRLVDSDGEQTGSVPSTTAPGQIGPGQTGASDDFDRASSDSLGVSASGDEWVAVSGAWGIEDGAAALIEGNEDGPRSIAVIDGGSADLAMEVRASSISQGWGIVFRYRGDFNYWMMTAAPEFATYNLHKVVNGQVVDMGSLGLAPIEDGSVIRVELQGQLMTFYVDGKHLDTIDDAHAAGATQVGLMAQGPAIEFGRWDDLVVRPTADPGPVAPPDQASDSVPEPG